MNNRPDFDDLYMPEPNSGCWIWMGGVSKAGYGYYRSHTAYRFSYEKAKGKVPVGLVLDHLCRNTTCVNPDHLEAVTTKENTLRGIGVTAVNAKKTHCINGHAFKGSNMRVRIRDGAERRVCKVCHKEYMAAKRALTNRTPDDEVGNGDD